MTQRTTLPNSQNLKNLRYFINRQRVIPRESRIEKERSGGEEPKHILEPRNDAVARGKTTASKPSAAMTPMTVAIAVAIETSTAATAAGARGGAEVVVGAPAVVAEDVVGLGDALEAESGAAALGLRGGRVLVRVETQRQSPEGVLDFVLGRLSPHAQRLVVIHSVSVSASSLSPLLSISLGSYCYLVYLMKRKKERENRKDVRGKEIGFVWRRKIRDTIRVVLIQLKESAEIDTLLSLLTRVLST